MNLVACARCGAHVRAAEACPFCARQRRGRVLATVLGLGLVACSGGPAAGPETPEAPEAGVPAAPETAAPESAAPETVSPESAAPPVALYGMPPNLLPPEKTP